MKRKPVVCRRCRREGPVGACSRLCAECAKQDVRDLETQLGLPAGSLDEQEEL